MCVHMSHIHVSPGPGFDSMSPDLSRRTTAHSVESTEGQETEKMADKASPFEGQGFVVSICAPCRGSTPTVCQVGNIWGFRISSSLISAAKFSTMLLSSVRVLGSQLVICAITWDQNEKSRGDKSGEYGGQW